jgi:hypothetical protein
MGQTTGKISKEKQHKQGSVDTHESQSLSHSTDPQAAMLEMQRAVGNQAVSRSMSAIRGNLPSERDQMPPIVQDVLRSPGQPVDPATRAFMESRFGHDFSNVRVHTNSKANESAQIIDANAYTVGRHVVFDKNRYKPGTGKGKRLLAHELAHVVQQRRGGRVPEGYPSAYHEQDASGVSHAVARGQAKVNVQSVTGVGLALAPKKKKKPESIVGKYRKYRRRRMRTWDKKLGRFKTPMSFSEYLKKQGPSSIKQHHLIPQEMIKKHIWLRFLLRRRGVDIHKYNIPLPKYLHDRIHHGKGGGEWNDELLAWFRNNPGFTKKQLREKIFNMLQNRKDIPSEYKALWPRYGRDVTHGESYHQKRKDKKLPDSRLRYRKKPRPNRGQLARDFYQKRERTSRPKSISRSGSPSPGPTRSSGTSGVRQAIPAVKDSPIPTRGPAYGRGGAAIGTALDVGFSIVAIFLQRWAQKDQNRRNRAYLRRWLETKRQNISIRVRALSRKSNQILRTGRMAYVNATLRLLYVTATVHGGPTVTALRRILLEKVDMSSRNINQQVDLSCDPKKSILQSILWDVMGHNEVLLTYSVPLVSKDEVKHRITEIVNRLKVIGETSEITVLSTEYQDELEKELIQLLRERVRLNSLLR